MAKRFEELTIRDNFMFGQVMSDPEICREVLETILGEPIGKLTPVESEKTVSYTADGKPIRLDILTEEQESRSIYNAEMQNLNKHKIGDLVLGKRSRYYQSVIDAAITAKAVNYKDLKDSNIVFICTFDPFGLGKYRYTFRNRCDEDHKLTLEDGTRKIFFNTEADDPAMTKDVRDLFGYVENGEGSSDLVKRIDAAVKAIRAREDLKMGYWSVNAMLTDEHDIAEAEGIKKGSLRALHRLVQNKLITKEVAADQLGMTPDEFDSAVKALGDLQSDEVTSEVTPEK